MIKAGLDYLDKNNILKLRDEGKTADEIAVQLEVRVEQVINYIVLNADKPRPTKGRQIGDEGEKALQALLSKSEPKAKTKVKPKVAPLEDEYGPLKGSLGWEELTPGERSMLSRKRNKAKEEADGGDNRTVYTGTD